MIKFYALSPQERTAMGWMLGWSLTMSVITCIAKSLPSAIPTPILTCFRFWFGLMFAMPYLLWSHADSPSHAPTEITRHSDASSVTQIESHLFFRIRRLFYTQRFSFHLLRIMLAFGAITCTYYGYRMLPLTLAISIGFSGPLLTTLLSILFFKERINAAKWMALFMGYASIVICLNPVQIMASLTEVAILTDPSESSPLWGISVLLLANLLASCTVLCVKKLSQTESKRTLLMYLNLGCGLLGIGLLYWYWPLSLSLQEVALLACLGCLGALSQYCSLSAYVLATPSFLAPIEYTRFLFGLPLGWVLFNEVVSMHHVIGGLGIIGSTYLLTQGIPAGFKTAYFRCLKYLLEFFKRRVIS